VSSDACLIDESNLAYSSVCTLTVPVSNSSAVRVYSDSRPHNLKIGGLQKGLILVHDGIETVGEGSGFGLPVLKYSDETYFAATSKVRVARCGNRWVIRKEFVMDRVARNAFKNVVLENRKARGVIAFLARLYQIHPHLRFLSLKDVTRRMSIGTSFLKAKPAGEVTATYVIDERCILVRADFSRVKRQNLEKVFVLNEQGSGFYRKYLDSAGTRLTDDGIGAWDGIGAEWACLMTSSGTLGFRMHRVEDAVLRRGREFLRDSLDWVGLDYEIGPGDAVFEYSIEIMGD